MSRNMPRVLSKDLFRPFKITNQLPHDCESNELMEAWTCSAALCQKIAWGQVDKVTLDFPTIAGHLCMVFHAKFWLVEFK